MSKQWGHGYHTGLTEGFDDGHQYVSEQTNPAMWALERANLLLYSLERMQGQPESWLLMRMISETLAPHIAGKRWHEDFDERNKSTTERAPNAGIHRAAEGRPVE